MKAVGLIRLGLFLAGYLFGLSLILPAAFEGSWFGAAIGVLCMVYTTRLLISDIGK